MSAKRTRSGWIRSWTRRTARAAWDAGRPLLLDYMRSNGPPRSGSAPPRSSRLRRKKAKNNLVQVAVSGSNNGGNPKPKKHSSKRGSKPIRTLKQLKKKVVKISKMLNCNNSVFNSFENDAFTLASAINRCAYGSYRFIGQQEIEVALQKLPYANPATLGTKQEVNVVGAAQPTKWCVKTSSKFCVRNNYLHPVVVDAYMCRPKNATGNAPHTQVTNGFGQMEVLGTVTALNPSLYPSHSKLFNDGWKITRHEKVTLEAGAEIILSHYETFKNYDHKYWDIYTSTYQPKYSRMLMLRIQGVCGHDVVNPDLVGITEAKVDIVCFRKVQIIYPGNFAPLQTIADVIGFDAVADDEVAVQNGIVHDDL